MKELSDYERQKQEHKRKLVRNEFAVCGKYDNIVSFLPTTYEWTKDLDPKERLKFMIEKKNRGVV